MTSSNELSVFKFDKITVRTVVREDGEPWFVAKDVALALGYTNTRKAVRDHCKAASAMARGNELFPPTEGLDSQTIVIPERDVYRLIMRSNLPSAEKFEEWVVGEVLPSIRKTGQYQVTNTQEIAVPKTPSQMMIVIGNAMAEIEDRQSALEASQAEDKDRLHRVEVKQNAIEEGFRFFTSIGYAASLGISITLTEAQKIGRAAAKLSRERKIAIDRVRDPRFGHVGAYHEEVLKDLFKEMID